MLNLEYGLKRAIMLIAGVGLAMGTTACSTTQTVKVAQSAPITYKVGQGAAKYASTAMPSRVASTSPYMSSRPTAPQVIVPDVSRPAPRATAPIFDQSRVDRTLYKHQKVGKRYTIMGKSYTPKHQPDYNVVGIASWYGDKFHGKPTATGEIYNKNDITAAHKTLPLNSMVHVTNLENGKTLMVRVNDRGPFIGKRIIDLSEAAATMLGTKGKGLGKVRVQYAGPADPMAAKRSVPAPRPRQEQAPQIAEAPRSLPTPAPAPTQEYRPLRQQPMEQAPTPYTAPQVAERPVYTAPRSFEPVPDPITPQAPQPYAAQPEPEDGGQVTLTIKGPIHVAGHSDTHQQPRLIKERLKTK
ncbi:septal ring lytic transglycosylase RlpA family protein [Hellea balneolensis]|uniref:septal ring lytic transglycosylase RlpA family protein n=1 Tax=Hellea balneolensis TaxID=287478 RepID=UPI0003FD7E41|nr:septal ring lytic transglycosylase RlpA family protein [Hellea balneolensis]